MIYLDNNATTLLDPEVFLAIQPLMHTLVGNPSSVHRYGQQAKALLTDAFQKCAAFFEVRTDEIVFTSGATEALNFLIRSLPAGSHVITSSLEHVATIESLKLSGASISYLDPLPGQGALTVDQVQEALRENTCLIVLSAANNETGVKTDIAAIGAVAERAGIPFVVDGVASLGKEPFHLPTGAAAACFSGHKIHAPLGVGLAIVKKGCKTPPFIVGGPQQRGLRAGTENLPGIIGFAKALELISKKGETWFEKLSQLRDRFEAGICSAIPDVLVHGKGEPRVSNTSNIAFLGVDGETLLILLDLAGVAASHGSACSSGALQPSRVLLNMGIDPKIVRSSLRFSLSRFTTQEEIDQSVAIIAKTVRNLRKI